MMMSESGCHHQDHDHYHCVCVYMHAYIHAYDTYLCTWIWVHTHLYIYACACADDLLSVSVLARQAPQPASPATPASSSRLQVLKVCACEGERGGVWERKMLLTPLSVFDKKEAGPHAVSLPVPPVDWMTCVCIYMFVVVSLQKKKCTYSPLTASQ